MKTITLKSALYNVINRGKKGITSNFSHYNSVFPFQVITVGAYIIATMFFNVYSMGVDTMFLCFRECSYTSFPLP
jgi:hypothetical protein